MICIKDTHPDVMKFITHKMDLNLTQGANMSVMMSDEFFRACEKNENWTMSFTRPETGETVEKTVSANDILELLAKTAWDYAEPGILFWDTVSNYNMLQNYDDFEFAGTNPCGELPLPAGGSCLLGSMNLSKYYLKLKYSDMEKFSMDYFALTGKYPQRYINFDYVSFYNDVKIAVRALNNILEEGAHLHPLKEQIESVTTWRQIGLGVMGIADLLYKCEYVYGDDDSIVLMDSIGYFMAMAAVSESVELAVAKGPFFGCKPDKMLDSDWFKFNISGNPFFSVEKVHDIEELFSSVGIRNSQLLTIAPTGTISTIFGVSGGIEPIFSLHFTRTTKSLFGKDVVYDVYPKPVKDWVEKNNITDFDNAKKPSYFVTSRDIPYKNRIRMQAIWQNHIDNSISSTINLPSSTTVDDIITLILESWKSGLKGITIYREGCKRFAILNDKTKKDDEKEESSENLKIVTDTENHQDTHCQSVKSNCKDDTCCDHSHTCNCTKEGSKMLTRDQLGRRLDSATYYVAIACGHIYITISKDENGRPLEVFMSSSKSGGCSANAECLGRYASACLRAGMDPEMVIDITKGVKCPACTNMIGRGEKLDGLSCGDAMAKVLQEELAIYKSSELNKTSTTITINKTDEEIPNIEAYSPQELIDMGYCPECGHKLVMTNGCLVCTNCPFSKCG